MIKVIHLIDSGGLYGAEKMLLSLVENQLKQGMEPVIISVGDLTTQEKLIEIEARTRKLPIVSWRMKSGFNIRQAFKIISWAKRNKFDIIHSHGYKFNILMAIFPRVIRRLPVVATLHGYVNAESGSKMYLYEWLDKRMLPRLDHICLVGEHMLELEFIKNISKTKVSVIENGISLTYEEHGEVFKVEEKFKLNERKINILFVGRLSPEKNVSSLISAVSRLISNGISIRLWIAGEGRLKNDLLKQVGNSNNGSDVVFLGYRSDIRIIMTEFDALVMPSLTEGLPITLLEAMSVGLPIVASRVGAIPKLLDNGDCGTLIEPGSDESLYVALKALCNDVAGFNKKSQLAKDKFRKQYSSSHMGEKYLRVYSNICDLDYS